MESHPLGSSALTGPPDRVLIFMGASHIWASLVVLFSPVGQYKAAVSYGRKKHMYQAMERIKQ